MLLTTKMYSIITILDRINIIIKTYIENIVINLLY